MKSILFIIFLLITITACNNTASKNSVTEYKDNVVKSTTPKSLYDYKISWSDSSREVYAIDTLLTHKNRGFLCDSAIAVDYIGFIGEHTFLPLNNNGQWINTIKKSKKLSIEQINFIHSILGSRKSFSNPMDVFCYEPRLGIVYYKNDKIIGQSAICLSCARLESTAKLSNGETYSSFNKEVLRKLEKLCIDLQFSDCKHWQD